MKKNNYNENTYNKVSSIKIELKISIIIKQLKEIQ